MARSRKANVYYNSDTDTWVNDSHEEPYLMPGTEAYEFYQKQLSEKNGREFDEDDEFHQELEAKNEHLRDEQLEREYDEDKSFDVTNRKFRRRMSKDRQNEGIQKIVDDGLGKHVDISGNTAFKLGLGGISNQDELYDDGINDRQYAHEVIKDYKEQFDAVTHELSSSDTDKDGDIDEDDIMLTPGMKRMARYM